MNKNTAIVMIVVALVFGLAIGFGSGYLMGQKITASGYEAQITKAKAFFPQMADVRSISGTVKSVSGNSVTISTITTNPFDDSPAERIIIIGVNTRIVKDEPKDPIVFQQEMLDFQKAMKNLPSSVPGGANPATPPKIPASPLSFNEKDMKLSDLKEGAQISVEAGENIKAKTQFEAVKITISSIITPAVPLPTTPVVPLKH